MTAARSARLFQLLIDFLPVDYVPPGGDVVRPAILIFQIIGVLPNVQPKDRFLSFHDGAVLIRGGCDLEFAEPSFKSHAQPEPNRDDAAASNFSLKQSKLPKFD